MAAIKIDLAAEFVGKKAFKDADKATSSLEKQVSKLGKQMLAVFSVTAVTAFAKSSVRAFAEMSAEQDRLTRLMKVGTGASAIQIQALNSQAKALENLGVVSAGNVTQVQSQLATFNLQAETIEKLTPSILDYVTAEKGATASTEQFKQMTNGLAQALNGNFTSLTRVGFVIDKTTKDIIKNGNESKRAAAIVKVLDSTYKGFNESLRDTPIGQMQLLTQASQEARETIGKGLVDALVLAGGENTNIDDISASMKNLSIVTSDVIRGIGVLAGKLNNLNTNTGGIFGFEGIMKYSGLNLLRQLGADTRPAPRANRNFGGSSIQGNLYDRDEKARLAREKRLAAEEKRLAALKLKAAKALTAEQRRQAQAKKQSALFDLDQIALVAALQNNLSEDERLRVRLQLALLTDNTTQAEKLSQRLANSIDETGKLAQFLKTMPDARNPFEAWDEWLRNFSKNLANATGSAIPTTTGAVTPAPSIPTTNVPNNPLGSITSASSFRRGEERSMELYNASQAPIVVQIDGRTIATAMQDQSLSGVPIRSLRTLGGFTP